MNELNDFENFNPMSNSDNNIDTDGANPPAVWPMRQYTQQGCTYRIPTEGRCTNYTFQEIIVGLGDTTISDTAPDNNLFLSSGPSDKFELIIKLLIDPCKDPMDEELWNMKEDVYIYLYKEGVSTPILQSVQKPDNEDDIYIDWSECADRLTPGKYFFLFTGIECQYKEKYRDSMGGHQRYAFNILESGRKMPHPTIRTVHVCRSKKNEDAADFTAGEMQLNLQLGRMTTDWNAFSAECYSESLQLMGNAHSLIPEGKGSKNDLTLVFHANKMRVKGCYFAILSHNGEPFARIDFEWDGRSGELSGISPVKTDDKNYLLIKPYDDNLNWENIREIPGATDIKWELLQRTARERLNKIRSRLEVTQWTYNANFILIGPDNAERQKLANHIPHILNHSQRSTRFMHAGELIEMQNPKANNDASNTTFNECWHGTLCLYGLDTLQFGNGLAAINLLREKMYDEFRDFFLCLTGTEAEIARFFEIAPDLQTLFPKENRFCMQAPTLHEFLCTTQKELKSLSLSLSAEAQTEMAEKTGRLWNEGILPSWNRNTVKTFIETSILPGMEQRLLRILNKREDGNHALLTTVEAQDIDYSMFAGSSQLYEQSLKGLNEMVGLTTLKQNLNKTFCQTRFNQRRKSLGLATKEDGCHHMIFKGNPGTGKTTVAKMIGKIYHAMGLLSKGDIIVTERSRILGVYIGETERNMTDILEQAKGNVLFIDEAYTLSDGTDDTKDFGKKAIECLLTALSRKNPDMLVIMAGYDREMDRMLEANQGLKGRFPHHFHFDNYTVDELMQIALNLLKTQDYVLTESAEIQLRKVVADAVAQGDRHFSNARWIEQFLTHGVLPAMAERIMSEAPSDDCRSYQTIIKKDIELAGKNRMAPAMTLQMPRRAIGFTA